MADVWKECGHPRTAENTVGACPGKPRGQCHECKLVSDRRYRRSPKGLIVQRQANAEYRNSGKARAAKARHIASGVNNLYNRRAHARSRAYLASTYAPTPDKRVTVPAAQTVVVFNDVQIPFEDGAAVNQVLNVIARVRPDTVIINGDLIDCYRESKFLIDPFKAELAIEETHKRVRQLLAVLQDIPTKFWLGGNHEDRWRKTLWQPNKGPVIESLLREHRRVVGEFPMGDHVESFRLLYGVKDYGFIYYPYGHRLYLAEGNLIVTHGRYVSRHSGYSAKRTWEWIGKSVIVGHSHRMGSYLVSQDGRENGAWENGCLCLLEPEYDDTPNWQQGFSIVRIDGPEFNVVQVPIVRRHGEPVAVYQGG